MSAHLQASVQDLAKIKTVSGTVFSLGRYVDFLLLCGCHFFAGMMHADDAEFD
jgi:hypothetical protein